LRQLQNCRWAGALFGARTGRGRLSDSPVRILIPRRIVNHEFLAAYFAGDVADFFHRPLGDGDFFADYGRLIQGSTLFGKWNADL